VTKTTVAQVLRAGVAALRGADVAGAAGDARRIMAHILGITPTRLTLAEPDPISSADRAAFEQAIQKRARRVPVSHIIGGRAFYGRWFQVDSTVLDPRPETELLVAIALNRTPAFRTVLDLGTGSGCIVISLLAENTAATGVGSDVSAPALEMAGRNAATHGVTDRCAFVRSDWMSAVTGAFDLIVSNPPYIGADEMAGLARDVRDYEPEDALTDGADGLSAYRAIIAAVASHLTPGGTILLEIGPTQARPVSAMLAAAKFGDISVHQDLDGRDRVVAACRPASQSENIGQ